METDEERLHLEEIARERAHALEFRRAHAGTRADKALMVKGGLIVVTRFITHSDPNQPRSSADRDVPPDDPDYARFREYFQLNNPGDKSLKRYRWTDGKWIGENGEDPCE